MRTNRDWQALAKGAIKDTELARRQLAQDLSER